MKYSEKDLSVEIIQFLKKGNISITWFIEQLNTRDEAFVLRIDT